MPVMLKRVYDKPSKNDGVRILVDRLWPRGLTKEAAQVELWLKEIAPSDELRKWFHERPTQWRAFRQRYLDELASPEALPSLEQIHELVSKSKAVTLLFSSRNVEHNNAVVLKELLDGMKKPPRSTGAAGVAARVSRRAQAR
jgi:uncharacterized protein YeaO (DUF488 family)